MASKMIVFRTEYVIGMGGNLPFGTVSPTATLIAAVSKLASGTRVIRAVSRFYTTPCFPAGTGPDFVNAAVRVASDESPERMLEQLHGIEAQFARTRERRWAGRTLDLDLLACGDLVLPDADTQTTWRRLTPERQAREAPDHLILPHPRLQDRGFALIPMRDIAPDWVHPLLGLSVRAMCDALPAGEIEGICPL